ncbi:T9SS type A sorting domain-containing protein [Portibacter marinus]|uniref:T9SS type A sorting domain-containing protein n=1 Tax=Portibacter marinus TaxID=2898660 RepID=UPI001F25F7BC|nr:T9SS type A sorting domain-containing protein [Portibacter marinus]
MSLNLHSRLRMYSVLVATITLPFLMLGQLSIPMSGTSATIDFENSVTTVNNGNFTATVDPAPMPAEGGLSSNAWNFTGFGTSSDLVRGTDTDGGVTTGGIYAFVVGVDTFLGVQPAGSDFTPGTIILSVTNNTGQGIAEINLSYENWINNDQTRANSLNAEVSVDGSTYIPLTTFTSPEGPDTDGFIASAQSGTTMLPSIVPVGATFFIRWSGDDVSGSGSRDEFGIDDIVVTATQLVPPPCMGDAGPNQTINEGESAIMNASAEEEGTWSSDFGTFSSPNDPMASYTPGPILNDTVVTLTWTSSAIESGCTATDYTLEVTILADINADFSYDPAMICPRDGVGIPIFTPDAKSGIFSYSVVSGGPYLELDPLTGVIEAAESDEGEYTITNTVTGCGNLIITGVVDGDLTGGLPKAVELYALTDIADLSAYNIEVVNNGAGIDQGIDLPKRSLSAGDYYYISSRLTEFQDFFGFAPDLVDGEINGNGNDAVVLKCNGIVRDVFGDPDMDGSGEPWEYTNGWAYRMDDQESNSGSFDAANWEFSGPNGLMDEMTNANAANPMLVGSFSNSAPPPNTDVSSDFNVIIDFDANPGITLVCKGDVNISIDSETCFAEVTYLMLLQNVDPDGCYDYDIEIENLEGNLISNAGTYKVSVVSGYDGNSCWSTVNVEEKVAPILTCPDDATLDCAIEPTPENVRLFGITEDMTAGLVDHNDYDGEANAAAWGVGVQECSEYNLTFRDYRIEGECDGDTIIRTFTARDENGLQSSCEQVIFLNPEDLDNITLPDDYDCLATNVDLCTDRRYPYGTVDRVFPLNCDGAGTDWAVLSNGNPSPKDSFDIAGNLVAPGTGRIGGINCGTIQAGYTDIVVPICEEPGMECAQNSPSFKVVRQWKILDWCTGAIIEHNQIIKVMDTEPPVIEELPDVTITTTLWDCSASLELPMGESSDNCSEDIRVAYSSTAGSIVDGVLYLEDNAKTMVGGDTVQVMVDYYDCCGNTTSDTFAVVVQDLIPPVVVADLHTTVALSRFEEDGLAKIYAETFDDGSFDNCGPLSYGVRRMDGVCSGFRGEDKEGEFFEFIHFCCKDIGEPVMVEFRVCDDADMDGLAGGILGRIGPTEAEDVDFENDPDDNCNYAMIEVEVQDKLPPACSAPSDITIDCIDFAALGDIDRIRERDYDDIFGEAAGAAICDVDIEQELTSTEDCGLGEIVRTIKVTNENNGISATCFQVITVVVADSSENFLVCSDINFPPNSVERQTFDAAGYDNVWCETNPFNIGDPADDGEDLPAIDVMDCEGVNITAPIIDIDNLCSEVGINLTLDTFDFGGSACKKILAHWEVIDQCLFDENFFIDGEVDPYRPENGYFELYVEYDLFDTEGPVIECGDGFNAECDGSLAGQLSASATDNCTEPEFFGWNWRLDVGADGTVEFEGEGNTIEPVDIGMESFPEGQHIVTWIVSDGCGNLSSMDCPLGFEVVDSKEPTPYCYDGLATALMEMGGVTLWAADFDAGSFDNCGEVFVTIVPESDVEGLSDAEAYAASLNLVRNIETGKDEYGWTFGCEYIPNGVSNIIDVRLYATDEAGNFDYCTASLRLQDNLGACEDDEDGSATLGGNIATRDDQMVSEVEVEAMASNPEFPKYTSTDAEGNYAFYNNKLGLDYEITPGKTGDYRNGVTTLDLVLVQKHILGLEELSSMYQLIAADVNNDRQIKASDLLQLRKLILGVYPEDKLPSNDSWRFMSKQDDPEDKTQPWPFEEVANIQNLSSDMMSADFVAIKVGDVNGTVSVSEKSTAQVRNARAINLEIGEQRYAPGEEVKVAFTSADFKEVYGYQFTLAFGKDLDFVGFESGSLELSEANFGWNRLSEGLISTSYDNVKGVSTMAEEVLFTMIFKAKEVGTTASSIQINSRVTKAESYIGNGLEITDIQLRTNTDQKEAGFVLYQNEPNPFKQLTNISFNLPEAGNASLRVYDVTGKTLYSQSGTYAKGLNTIQVKNLGSTGVMYYQIESGEYTATKKMIVIR